MIEFESPVDCNSSQTERKSLWSTTSFESPVDCNSSQTIFAFSKAMSGV